MNCGLCHEIIDCFFVGKRAELFKIGGGKDWMSEYGAATFKDRVFKSCAAFFSGIKASCKGRSEGFFDSFEAHGRKLVTLVVLQWQELHRRIQEFLAGRYWFMGFPGFHMHIDAWHAFLAHHDWTEKWNIKFYCCRVRHAR